MGPIQSEFQRQLDIARDQGLLKQLPDTPLEGRPMPAPNSIKGLPGRLRDHLAGLVARAEKTANDIEGSAKNMHARMDEADKVKKEIDSAAAEMQQIVGMDNGGPEIEHGR